MIEMVRRTSRDAGVEISGIGIGSTGVVRRESGAFGDVDLLPGWQGNNPVRDLAREFKVTVALENDADASALGEAGWGAGKLRSFSSATVTLNSRAKSRTGLFPCHPGSR